MKNRMIKPILEKKWPASDGSTHTSLALAQEREILLILLNGRSDTPTDTEIHCAARMVTQANRVVEILRNRPARGKDRKPRKKSAAKATQEAKTKPVTGITFGRGGVTKEEAQ